MCICIRIKKILTPIHKLIGEKNEIIIINY